MSRELYLMMRERNTAGGHAITPNNAGGLVHQPQPPDHESRLTAHGSQPTMHGPRFTTHGSRLTVHGSRTSGLTLIELLVVMGIVSLMVSISYPTLTSGLDGIRLRTSIDRAGAFFHAAQQQADRRQRPVQLTVDPERNRLVALSVDSAWEDRFVFADGLQVVLPKQPRSFLLYPGTPTPQLRLLLETRAGGRAGLRINVFTGVPEKWDGE